MCGRIQVEIGDVLALLAEAGDRIFGMCGSDVAETMGLLNALH
jgi:hypothetical protein